MYTALLAQRHTKNHATNMKFIGRAAQSRPTGCSAARCYYSSYSPHALAYYRDHRDCSMLLLATYKLSCTESVVPYTIVECCCCGCCCCPPPPPLLPLALVLLLPARTENIMFLKPALPIAAIAPSCMNPRTWSAPKGQNDVTAAYV
jgi:hypothetical protein